VELILRGRNFMPDKKKAKEIADELGKLFKEMVDSLEIDDYYAHFYTELKIIKKNREHNLPYALSDEKIAVLEKAVEDFLVIYEAEKAEAAKMPLSWAEAARVRKLFEDADDFKPLPAAPAEH
jgi:hypothetical protein